MTQVVVSISHLSPDLRRHVEQSSGKIFFACDQYPKCDYAQWDQPIPVACPTCGNKHIDRKVRGRDERRVVLICPSCKSEMTEAEVGLGVAAST